MDPHRSDDGPSRKPYASSPVRERPSPLSSGSGSGRRTPKNSAPTLESKCRPSSDAQSADKGGSLSNWNGGITCWDDVNSARREKLQDIFSRLEVLTVPKVQGTVMSSTVYKSRQKDLQSKLLNSCPPEFSARFLLEKFRSDFNTIIFDWIRALPHLAMPWDCDSFAEFFHYKWYKISFTTPVFVEHMLGIVRGYKDVLEALKKADEGELKSKKDKDNSRHRKFYNKLGFVGKSVSRGFVGNDEVESSTRKTRMTVFDADQADMQDTVMQEWLINFGTFLERNRKDPNCILAGREPCDALIADLSHLKVLAGMIKQQKQYSKLFEQQILASQSEEDLVDTKGGKKKKGKGKNSKSGSGKALRSREDLLPEVKTIAGPSPPVSCLNSEIGYFPSRLQIITRMVEWNCILKREEDDKGKEKSDSHIKEKDRKGTSVHVSKQDKSSNTVCHEVFELANILRAELWLEQVWQESGSNLNIGDILIGIFPQQPYTSDAIYRLQRRRRNDDHQFDATSDELLLCTFVGARRNGILVQTGLKYNPIFLTWKQAVPLPEKWKELVNDGSLRGGVQLVRHEEKVMGLYNGIDAVVPTVPEKDFLEPTSQQVSMVAFTKVGGSTWSRADPGSLGGMRVGGTPGELSTRASVDASVDAASLPSKSQDPSNSSYQALGSCRVPLHQTAPH